VEKVAASSVAGFGFTASQAAAFGEIRRRKVVAVWGPPGTGKTHFLATTILGLADAHVRAGKPFRALVTAFTHAAIENLLKKIIERQNALPGVAAGLELAKVKGWRGSEPAPVEEVSEKHLAGWLDGTTHAVVGATVYSCLSARKKTGLDEFDLVVVDEASQVRVAESAVPAHLVAPAGRLVLAGDDMQLPPIVQGEYPEPEAGMPALHRSVFELVRRRVPEGSPVVQKLTDNHRMNDVLTSFAGGLVYGADYRCVGPAVASRRARLLAGRPICPLLSACLDPAYPLVAVILEGMQSLGENRVEAGLVARMVAALRDRLANGNGALHKDDEEFFRSGVFVVSPHRAQNRAIRRELRALRSWSARPFVDTVDKMQGQEAEAVIVSYGVADPEYALQEAEFIYSLNRLNVAVTRARTKTIVCLPAPLLRGSPAVLDVPEAAAGLAYMQHLIRAIEAQDAGTHYPVGENVRARVIRAGQLFTPARSSTP
jgi:hypothetical protein